MTLLLVPGLYNSGPEHWQTHWEREIAGARRVEQRDWSMPICRDWVQALDAAVRAADAPVAIAAHSLGCATVAHWAVGAKAESLGRVRGALLVAPSDLEAPRYPVGMAGFIPLPLDPLPFPTIVVASTDDEWVSLERATFFADEWGSRLVNVGALGHVNSASGLGSWAEGRALLESLGGTA